MEEVAKSSAEGQRRVDHQTEKDNEKLACNIEESEVMAAKKGIRVEERGTTKEGIEEGGVVQCKRGRLLESFSSQSTFDAGAARY